MSPASFGRSRWRSARRAAAAAFLALACSTTDRSADSAGMVTILYIGDERIWHPGWNMSAAHLVFLPLFAPDEDGVLRGKLVRDWEVSSDGNTWTYHLRSDVRWHDGVPVTAHDVAFTIDFLANTDVVILTPDGQTVSVVDDTTFTIAFRVDSTGSGFSSWGPTEWWRVVYPKHALDTIPLDAIGEAAFWSAPIGNGPYRYVRHVPKTMVELEANPDYIGGRPAIDRVRLRFGSTAYQLELMGGDADVAFAPAEEAFAFARQDSRFRAYWSIGQWYRSIHWNTEHPVLEDAELRRLLDRAIDRAAIARALDYPPDVPLYDVPAWPCRVIQTACQDLGTIPGAADPDPRIARAFDVAGWSDRDGDGVREKDGTPLRFTALVMSDLEDLAVIVQDQLAELGVALELRPMSGPAAAQRLARGEFEVVFLISRIKDLMIELRNGTHAGTSFPELTRIARALTGLRDTVRIRQLYEEFWNVWRREVPHSVVLNALQATLARGTIRGLASPHRIDAPLYMDELWIEEER